MNYYIQTLNKDIAYYVEKKLLSVGYKRKSLNKPYPYAWKTIERFGNNILSDYECYGIWLNTDTKYIKRCILKENDERCNVFTLDDYNNINNILVCIEEKV